MISEPKKIFVEAHMLDNGFEGSATFIRGLYLALVANYPNHYVIILGCRNPNIVLNVFNHHPSFKACQYKFNNRYLRLLYDIPRIIYQNSPHIAHFQYFTPIIKNCKWHVTIHDVIFVDYPQYFSAKYRLIRNILFRLSASRAELLSTVSKYSRSRISYWYGIKEDSIALIPNAVIEEKSTAELISDDVDCILNLSNGYLLCVSRFEPRKNQACLLRAFLKGSYWLRGIHLVFVGSTTLEVEDFNRAWRDFSDEAKGYVHFMSGISYAELQTLTSRALASIYPSMAEGFGIPPLEAAIFGVPSLCSKVTAMEEFDFPMNFFFDPLDPDSLVSAINHVLDNPDIARLEASEVMATMRRQYSWDISAEKLHQSLSKVF